jgi:transglutaminase-like putative cysteine protease
VGKIMVAVAVVAGALIVASGGSASRQLQQRHDTIHHLRAQLRRTESELARVRARLASTQKKLAAIPRPFSVAVKDVREEASWAGGTPQDLALAAMDYVIGHVRTGMYGYLEGVYHEAPGGPSLPSYREDVNAILSTQTGICFHAERVFGAIMRAVGLPVRDVGFNYTEPDRVPDSHSAAEVYYNGGWHFFDPTYGVVYKDASSNILSIASARAAGAQNVTMVKDNAAFVNLIENPPSPGDNDTWFEFDPATFVYYALQPK